MPIGCAMLLPTTTISYSDAVSELSISMVFTMLAWPFI